MKPVGEFMREFWDARAQFHRKYYDFLPGATFNSAEEWVESAKEFGSFAVVISRFGSGEQFFRQRYRLRPAGESWVIDQIKHICAGCAGTGKQPESGEDCSECKGEGWR